MIRLVQLQQGALRRVALVEEPRLRLLESFASVYDLAKSSRASGLPLSRVVRERAGDDTLDYDAVYRNDSPWRLLPPIDHPLEPARCLVSGTGLTHLGSAKNRQSMHSLQESDMNDSMKMFKWGVEGGKPAPRKIGVAPEWFYKGTGAVLRAHGQPLEIPTHGEDCGEEAEIAGIYLISPDGVPCRIGMAVGNEFSDHKLEKRNYLYLAGSKIRTCALGPEMVIAPEFDSVSGLVKIERNGQVLWSQPVRTGEREMCHSRANIEHHHFKFDTHRQPGDVHVHYFGTPALSFGAGVALADGDVMDISFDGFGRALRNPLRQGRTKDKLIAVQSCS
jgi:hypothetical protein